MARMEWYNGGDWDVFEITAEDCERKVRFINVGVGNGDGGRG